MRFLLTSILLVFPTVNMNDALADTSSIRSSCTSINNVVTNASITFSADFGTGIYPDTWEYSFDGTNYVTIPGVTGNGGSLTGTSVDIGIIDDPLKDRQEAQSSVVKEQLWNWYTDVFETRLHNGSAQVLIQTRWYDDDLAGRLLERDDDWTIIEFPAIREKAENSYDLRKDGEALWPEKHALEKLLRVKKNEPFTFESLYQQNPKPSVESLIYHDWQPCEFFPKDVDVLFSGLDFGFSNDPTALIRIAKLGNKLYLDEVIYQTGLTNSDLAKRIKLYPDKLGEIYADSADPKSIEELRREGLPIKKAVKGNDSVNAGISKLREYEVYYTRRSKNIKKEVDNYQWMMVGGKQINKPIDDFNHALDSIRYAVYTKYSKKKLIIF